MSTKSKIGLSVACVIILPLLGLYFLFFHMSTTAHVVSVSPDGMYKCELTERANSGQSIAEVVLYRRMSSWEADWEAMDSQEIRNDSACRSNYTIDWAYNKENRSVGVTVFGDFGGAPFSGTAIYTHDLDPAAKLR